MNLTKLNSSWKTIKVYNQLEGISEHDILLAIQHATPTAANTPKLTLQMSALLLFMLQLVCCQGM